MKATSIYGYVEGLLANLESRRNLLCNDFLQMVLEAEKAMGVVSAHKNLGCCSLEVYPLTFPLLQKSMWLLEHSLGKFRLVVRGVQN